MGTKVEYSINLLPTLLDSNNLLNVGGVDVWEHYHHNKGLSLTNNLQRTGINYRFLQQDSMDRSNIEYIKKTMQIHEDIFKHQVTELHRVYNVQKKLMNELKIQQHFGILNGIDATASHPHFIKHQTAQTSSYPLDHHNFHAQQSLRSRERSSGSCSGGDRDRDTIKLKRGFEFDLEMPAPEKEVFIGPCGTHECRTSNVGVSNEEIQVDLTLSIGGSSSSSQVVKKSDHHHHVPQLECLDSSPKVGGGECNDPTTPMSSSTSVTFSQERSKGPHWLSQGLKLK